MLTMQAPSTLGVAPHGPIALMLVAETADIQRDEGQVCTHLATDLPDPTNQSPVCGSCVQRDGDCVGG